MVVVADPDPVERRRLGGLLREDGLVVLEADGAFCLGLAAGHGFDLAVVDAELPGASSLRDNGVGREVPVVVVARSAGPLTDAVADALSAVGVLRKPVDEDDLRTIVWNLC